MIFGQEILERWDKEFSCSPFNTQAGCCCSSSSSNSSQDIVVVAPGANPFAGEAAMLTASRNICPDPKHCRCYLIMLTSGDSEMGEDQKHKTQSILFLLYPGGFYYLDGQFTSLDCHWRCNHTQTMLISHTRVITREDKQN